MEGLGEGINGWADKDIEDIIVAGFVSGIIKGNQF